MRGPARGPRAFHLFSLDTPNLSGYIHLIAGLLDLGYLLEMMPPRSTTIAPHLSLNGELLDQGYQREGRGFMVRGALFLLTPLDDERYSRDCQARVPEGP